MIPNSYPKEPPLFEAIGSTNSNFQLPRPQTYWEVNSGSFTHRLFQYSCVNSHTLSPSLLPLVVATDKPTINVTKLPRTIPVFNGYPEDLVCEADGNPPPDVVWLRSGDSEPCGLGSTLTVSEAGFYSCNASNTVGLVTHQVQVILKGNSTSSLGHTAIRILFLQYENTLELNVRSAI